jgi:hypothetical protein
MSSIKVVMVVKQSALKETMAELGDVLAGENVVVKVEKDYVFDSMFNLNTERVEVDIDDDLLFEAMLMAHEKNITLNQYLTETLADQIERMDKEKKDFVVDDKKTLFKPKAETSFSIKETIKDANTIPDMIKSKTIKPKSMQDYEKEENINLSSKFGNNPCGEIPLKETQDVSLHGLVDELLKKT